MGKRISNYEELPIPNKKVYDLVLHYTVGNVRMFAEYIGVTQQVLDRIFKKDSRNQKYPKVSDGIKDALKAKFNFNDVWFYDENNESNEDKPKINFAKGVPYYNVDFIGGFDLVLNDQTINPEYLIDFQKYNNADCWCNVTGHSMEPEINHGDIIALKKIEDKSFLPLGEVYAIVTTNDMRTIKRLGAGKTDDTYTLIPSNKSPEYSPQQLPARMIRTIFQVLGAVKRF